MITTQNVESNVDAIFLLDGSQTCVKDSTKCLQASAVSLLTKPLTLGNHFGSVSLFYNSKGVDRPVSGVPVLTDLYASLYNSTSNQCASCKALYTDASKLKLIEQSNVN